MEDTNINSLATLCKARLSLSRCQSPEPSFTSPSESPVKESSQSLHRHGPFLETSFFRLSKSSINEPPSRSLNGAPMERDSFFQSLASRSPVSSPLSRFPSQSSHRERSPVYRAFFICLLKTSVRGAHLQVTNEDPLKTPVPKVCFYLFLGDPNNPYPTAFPYGNGMILPFPYGNGMILHFYQQQESSTTKTVHKVINKRLKTYV